MWYFAKLLSTNIMSAGVRHVVKLTGSGLVCFNFKKETKQNKTLPCVVVREENCEFDSNEER